MCGYVRVLMLHCMCAATQVGQERVLDSSDLEISKDSEPTDMSSGDWTHVLCKRFLTTELPFQPPESILKDTPNLYIFDVLFYAIDPYI